MCTCSQRRRLTVPSQSTAISNAAAARRLFASGGRKNGFENFRPKHAKGAAEGEAGKAGSEPPNPLSDVSLQQALFTGGLALLALSSLFAGRSEQQEISWQEFKTSLLERNAVVRLEVANKSVVKVFVQPQLSAQLAPGRTALGLPETPASGERSPTEWRSEPAAPQSSPSSRSEGIYRFRFSIGSVETFERRLEEVQLASGVPAERLIPVTYVSEMSWFAELARLAPTVALLAAYMWFTRRQMGSMGGGGMGGRGIFSVGKANVTTLDAAKQKRVLFADVAGCDEAKAEVTEFVHFLRHPAKYKHIGATLPRGALLVGPPGTGKTLLAKAVAGEAGVPFLSMSGSDFMEMFVGVGPSRVRDLFAQARAKAPSIIFIDEIDAIGRARGRGGFAGGNDERENTLNQLLVEMDGFGTTEGVIVMAATNRPDTLDRALLRPGRFDRQISVDLPDVAGRERIMAVHLAKIKLEGGEAIRLASRLAALTPGFSGADLANVVNEAALIAARRDSTQVSIIDCESAIDRIIGGLEKKHKVISPEERRTVAYHEAGHAVTGWFLKHAEPLLKVSIVPRGAAALGFAQYLPSENLLATDVQLMDMMCMTLGGRASEQLIFGNVSTGAQNDLEKVTRMAYSRVAVYGMNSRVGLLSFPPEEGRLDKPYSPDTAKIIDEEVRELVAGAYTRTLALLTEKRHFVEALAKELLEREVLGLEQLTAVLGERPYGGAGMRNIDRYRNSQLPAAEAILPREEAPPVPPLGPPDAV